ncbi:MAG: cytochrome P450 [Gemmatimonadetes bacterium]|nr:cytochrome P450 [Gemmatimonadota bacterium]
MSIPKPPAAVEVPFPPFIRRTLGHLSRRMFAYDEVVRVRPGWRPWYLITHPDDLRHVLVGAAANYIKTPFLTSQRGKRRAGQGLLTRTGDAHREQRRLLQPLFHPDPVTVFTGAIGAEIERRFARWTPGRRIDLADEMADLTQSVIVSVLFGDELAIENRRALVAAINTRRAYTEHLYHGKLPYRDRLPTRIGRANRAAVETIDRIVFDAITKRRAAPDDDLLTRLIGVQYRDGSSMSDRQVRDEVVTFTSTGYETLGEALAWAFYLLARDPEADARLVAEPEFAAPVLHESMRLFPPTWIFARIPKAADTLPSGGLVEAGATLFLCPYLQHRHPRYFPDAERFAPQRFIDDPPPRFVYIPFGDGPHKCLGEHLARLEGTMVLAQTAPRLRFELDHNFSIELHGGITLRPIGGLPATVRAR